MEHYEYCSFLVLTFEISADCPKFVLANMHSRTLTLHHFCIQIAKFSTHKKKLQKTVPSNNRNLKVRLELWKSMQDTS